MGQASRTRKRSEIAKLPKLHTLGYKYFLWKVFLWDNVWKLFWWQKGWMYRKICWTLWIQIQRAYVDIGFGPADCCDDENWSKAGQNDDQGVDGDERVGQPVRDCQHWQLKGGESWIIHDLETVFPCVVSWVWCGIWLDLSKYLSQKTPSLVVFCLELDPRLHHPELQAPVLERLQTPSFSLAWATCTDPENLAKSAMGL